MGVLLHIIEQLRPLLPHRGGDESRQVRGVGRCGFDHVGDRASADASQARHSGASPASMDAVDVAQLKKGEVDLGVCMDVLKPDFHHGCRL